MIKKIGWLFCAILLAMGSLSAQQFPTEFDSLQVVLKNATDQDSLKAIERISQVLPYDSAQYGLDLVEKGLAVADRLDDHKYRSHMIFYKGLFFERLGDLETALENYLDAYHSASSLNEHLFAVNALLGVSVIHQKKGNYDLSLQWSDSLQKHAEPHLETDVELYKLYLRALDISGDGYYFKGENEQAIAWYTKIVELTSIDKFPELLANAYKGISAVYSSIGRLAESVDYGHKALNIFESINDLGQVGRTLNELGRTYVKLGEMDKALDFYERSLAVKEERGDWQGMTATYQNIGIVHSRQKNYGLALEYYQKSREIKEELGIKRGMAALSINIGLIHKRLGEFDKAEDYYFDGLRRAEETGSTTYKGIALSNLSSLYLSWSKFELARQYGLKAVETGKARKSKSALFNAYYNLHEAYVGLGDYKKAYDNYVITMQYNDSLVEQRNASQIARIEQEYAKERDQRQLELNDKQLALVSAQQRLENNTRMVIILISLAALLVAGYIIRQLILRSRRKETAYLSQKSILKLKAELTSRELEVERLSREIDRQELAQLSQEMAAKNAKLNQLEEDLEKLTQDYVSEQVKGSSGLAETVLSQGSNGKEWSRFMEYFQSIYHDYLERLKAEFSEITSNELRLCALIKINLSTKEIANALNITPESLRTAKYRLRKKLGINNDEKLNDFLLKF